MRKVFIVIAVICIAVLANFESICTEGYLDQMTEMMNARKRNDEFLNSLLQMKGYAGTKDPDENAKDLTESARIIHTYYCADGSLKSDHLFNSCFYDIKSPWSVETHPLLYNPYTTRELADGQMCLKDDDCYSRRCVYSRCKSYNNIPAGWSPPGWSPPGSRTTLGSVIYNTVKYTTLFALSFVVFALIFFGGDSDVKSPKSPKA